MVTLRGGGARIDERCLTKLPNVGSFEARRRRVDKLSVAALRSLVQLSTHRPLSDSIAVDERGRAFVFPRTTGAVRKGQFMFKLEAVRALHGDALLVHYGTEERPRYALIDGGPAGVWNRWLRPRLQQLRKDDKAVPLQWMLLSHVDEDHVLGLIDLVQELRDAMPRPSTATASSRALFHNTPGVLAVELCRGVRHRRRRRLDPRLGA